MLNYGTYEAGDLLMCVGAGDHPLTVGKVYEVQTCQSSGFWSEWPWLRADDGQLRCFPQQRFMRVTFSDLPRRGE